MDKKVDLAELRMRIDQYDREILKLLEKRLDCVIQVAEHKLSQGMKIFDNNREMQVLEHISGLTENPAHVPYIRDTYIGIMDASKNLQKKIMDASQRREQEPLSQEYKAMKVAYQGVPGSYSEEAMYSYFGEEICGIPYKSFEDTARAVISEEAEYGLLAIENSSAGTVTATMDLLAKGELYIVGEYVLPVSHNLVALPGTNFSDIQEVYSHTQGLLQCVDFLKQYPNWEQNEYSNTAAAAKMVAEDGSRHKAAISSKRAAALYGLQILAEGIQGRQQNATRFVIFSKQPQYSPLANKISISFSVPHTSGSLFETLKLISRQGLNLLKIESRPLHQANWEYVFFIDFEGNMQEPVCQQVIRELEQATGTFRFLGNYRKDEKTV